ncbi:hypothetical protein SELMODRAFT_147927 [Selaginella moellendorffii]|uniref:Ribulose bisphosphate carboxylase small subunit, chloroplastic n=1 Tax=Selaginella moellendorffii TaxID=88036 RepID=D8RKP5_SELML|nr:ribulose bisphosphate carboxylase small chain clone 512 [Selaginella moellendorffii]EFJ27478.1 hypothetical protein SELMODRAFT_147927 [Selaginella moellendorffii]|eukprot:XP_002971729.1 ribulose bisphosphate carboxylase small chain clone 512 [Selaginella moellendorffii]
MVAGAASSAVIPMAALSTPMAPKVPGFTGLKATTALTANKGGLQWSQKTVANGSRVSCMLTWTPYNNPRFETLSYLPDLSPDQIAKEIDYMLKKGWFPCLEFSDKGYVYRECHKSPGCYDGRYWTMYKLPMFGCQDSAQVLREIEECKKDFPTSFIRVLGFDRVRQVQCAGFIVFKPT